LLGLGLSDGHFERSSPTSGTRVCIQFTVKTPGLFDFCLEPLRPFVTETPKIVDKEFMKCGKTYKQKCVRTVYNSIFTEFHEAFYIPIDGEWLKVFPTVTFLKENLNDIALAVLFMGDGSRKGKDNRGYEVHCQGTGFESAVRLCLALYENFGIECWPAKDVYKLKNLSYWNIYISASSFSLWEPLVEQTFRDCDMYESKMPNKPKTKQHVVRGNSKKFNSFLKLFQNNNALRQNVYYQLPEHIVDEWREIQKKK